MKTLILMRHAKAEHGNFEISDFDRKLTEKGKSDADIAAKILAKKIKKIDLIVTSSAKRTLKTAKIIAENFDIDKNKIHSINEIYEADSDAYVHVLRSLNDDKVKTVIVVGHNPTIGAMAAILSGNEIVEFKPSSFAVFNLTIDTWKMFRIAKAENILSYTP
ncbi:MAG: phosphohistidine phosphatase SixA [Bacteroidia bacterium]|nr:phosphohistidine phosphatase SixA [Bacteroidia bacterium]